MPEETKPKRARKAKPPKTADAPALLPSGVTPDEYWSLGLEQYNPDKIVRSHGLKTYREMIRRDPVVALGLQFLETARLAKGWQIVAGEGERAEELARFTRYALAQIEGHERDLLHDMLDALPMGYAVIEKVPVMYEDGPYRGKWGYLRFSSKWQESMDLVVDKYGDLEALKYKGALDYGKTIEGDDLSQFIVFVPNRSKGNWYGESVLRPIYRVYTIKDHLTRYLAVHMEKFGSGTIVQKTEALPGDRQTILDGLVKHSGSMAYVVGLNEDLVINYPPPGVGDGLVQAIEHCNAEILKGLSIPQTMFSGTGSSGQGGSLALSETHERTFAETVDRIGRSLEDAMDEQVIRPLIEWNYPNVSAEEMPTFRFDPYQEEDGAAQLERLKLAKELGADLLLDDVYEAAGAERPGDDTPEEEIIGGGKPEPPPSPFGFQQPPALDEETRARFAEAARMVNAYERKVNFVEIERKLGAIIDEALAQVQDETAAIKDATLEIIAEEMAGS